jgi:hypothetical protein
LYPDPRLGWLSVRAILLLERKAMKKMDLRPLPERVSITLFSGRGGDKANEGWFFLNPDQWEEFKVKLANSSEAIRSVQRQKWHDIDVFSSDEFDAAIRDLRSQRYFGGCMMEPL